MTHHYDSYSDHNETCTATAGGSCEIYRGGDKWETCSKYGNEEIIQSQTTSVSLWTFTGTVGLTQEQAMGSLDQLLTGGASVVSFNLV